MNVICLVIDRLHTGHLGAYGNSWIETPGLDRFAAEALTFDHLLIDSPDLEKLYRSYWHGLHALCRREPPADRPSLAAALRQAGVNSTLLTDDRSIAEHALAVDFDELIEIDRPWDPQPADEIEQTHFARCVVRTIEWLESARGPFLLWCHLGSLATAWDAPPRFRRAYREEGDPESARSADVPEMTLADDADPDDWLPLAQAYAGQVSLLDTCLGALLDFVDGEAFGSETVVVLTGSRGFPLAEHRRFGPCDEALYGELVHAPLMIRLPDRQVAARRSQALIEPADLWAALLRTGGVDDLPDSPTAGDLTTLVGPHLGQLHDRLCLVGPGSDRAIRTPAWYLRMGSEPELFAKPDDRWEVNNVAGRCQEVVECLEVAFIQYEQTLQAGHTSDLTPLSELLASGLR
ncbi:MAG: sulfatase-like hydrolase/transferase [Candidatus Nealsonbacteria bacterium]|nr:sulfatase-like hydrolase/transferase [Candidatus Nealsonbacteria bacterium]